MDKENEKAPNAGIFDKGIEAIEKLTHIAEEKGTRNISIATGIVILILLIVEFITTGDYVPNKGEIIGLIIGGVLILAGILISSLEYRWYLNAQIREREIIKDQLKIEADYNIARLKKTDLRYSKELPSNNITLPPP